MFKLHSEYKPTGDQPQAIEYLSKGIKEGKKFQTLLGVTGSGKTFTMANIIQKVQRPTLVLAHNKTLAGQLYSEFKEFFPENNVEYFVSYYDYYQPESYIPSTDTYIEKDSSINDEIDKLRHSATLSLFETRDVIIVASVSCIYGLGDPIDYQEMMLSLRPGMSKSRDQVLKKLISMQYTRNEIDFKRGTFRAKGDIVEIYPSDQSESAVRVEFWGDEIEKIVEINALTGKPIGTRRHILISPASHYVTTKDKMERAIVTIEQEMEERVKYFKSQNKLIEAQRIEERTNFDIEMMKETGFCSGIENYSRHISGRQVGSPPYTLFDYFPKDFLLLIDESHATIPQVKAMYNGDRARKESLVNYGFRLPSAFDNRPLTFKEFEERINQVVFVSATPADYEKEHSKDNVVEQIIRPTGLLDPKIEVKPVTNQIDDLLEQIRLRIEKKERVLVTTLTKKMAEDLTEYLKSLDIKVNYIHSDTKALERMKIIRDLRLGEFDVLVGINLLREGLDIPEVSLVAILDADKEGFLRSERSLIQTIGRAARNTDGTVIMYADELTESMEKAISETNRRRKIQEEYNKKNGIIPKTIKKSVRDNIKVTDVKDIEVEYKLEKSEDIKETISKLTDEMLKCATEMEFEKAAELRDKIRELEKLI
ncbi:MAG: excinuclease ABC subunit UvrB [Clostridia bacterium]|jgi:excinuclease ABC subunit B|nr:excinuclease ABC subunit UvrB [Clostridia bacterium]CDC06794.1 uvrABC system protein B [Clostridium sp. CAG:343]HCF33726.1 excinuclease ABC subunit UvrB [Clostridiales bacterium]MBP8634635.1 excinuclease ABC subunit UvrB [Clostridia bacterium]MBP9922053.1 excinuclease ABC subunit UvrB [Clostridia bacterium]